MLCTLIPKRRDNVLVRMMEFETALLYNTFRFCVSIIMPAPNYVKMQISEAS